MPQAFWPERLRILGSHEALMIFKDGIRPEWEVDWVDASFGCLLVLSGFPVVSIEPNQFIRNRFFLFACKHTSVTVPSH